MKAKVAGCIQNICVKDGFGLQLVTALLLFAASKPGQAQDYTWTTDNGAITITGYIGSSADVTIPSTIAGLPVTAIGDLAFSGDKVTSVTIPSSVITVGEAAFGYCPSLTSITVDPLNPYYSSVAGVLFYDTQTVLLRYPCGKSGPYTIPDGVTSIGPAFEYCTKLTGISMPSSLTQIGSYAFYCCTSLTSVAVSENVEAIGGSAFEYCLSLTNVSLPNALTTIGRWAFSSCMSLGSIAIPDGVTVIYEGLCGDCGSLTNVSLGNSVAFIRSMAFISCTNLYNITIPNSVTNIEGLAFGSCSALTNINLGTAVMSLGAIWNALRDCSNVTSITVDLNNPLYSSGDGVLFNKDQTVLLACPTGKFGPYTIPATVTTIGGNAFYGCNNLTSITIPQGVLEIRDLAFSNCANLTTVAIPDTVTRILSFAFWNCTSLTNVNLPNSIWHLGASAFQRCTSLINVTLPNRLFWISANTFSDCYSLWTFTIPASVTNIDPFAFSGCTNLMDLRFQGNTPTVASSAFVNVAPDCIVYHLPDRAGWGPTFAGFPTALWVLSNPTILINGRSFGVTSNAFGFVISWATNASVVVEACNPASSGWLPVSTNALNAGSSYFSDADWAKYPGRLYRVRSQ